MISQKNTPLKRIGLYIVILAVSIFTNGCAQSKIDDNTSPEALAKTLLSAVKTNDQTLFDKHLLTVEDDIYSDTLNYFRNANWYTTIMQDFRKVESESDKYKTIYERMDGGKEAWLAQYNPDKILENKRKTAEEEIANKSKNAFRLKDKFRERGLTDWSNVEFENFSFRFVRDGQVTNNNKIRFRNGDYIGAITMPAFIKASDGTWRFHNQPSYSNYGYLPSSQ